MRRLALALASSAVLVGACGGGTRGRESTPGSSASTSPAASASSRSSASAPLPGPVSVCAATSLSGWTLEQKAAQLVAAPALDVRASSLTAVVRTGVGAILLLGPAPADLAAQLTSVRRGAGAIPPLVMADEEGGGVQRLEGLIGSFPWPRSMAETMTPAGIRTLAARVGRRMRAIGVDVDLAPVLDVDAQPGPSASNPDGRRAFSGDPAVVAQDGVAFAAGLGVAGVLAVAKHFPGLGSSSGNTDYSSATTLPLPTLMRQAFPPFAAAVAARIPAVMVANASVPGLTTLPATLSSQTITDVLRTSLRFNGLVMTDSLSAGAIATAGYDVPHAAAASVAAGADLVLFGSTLTADERRLLAPANVERTVRAIIAQIVAAVRSGRLPTGRLDEAVQSVLTVQRALHCR